MAAGIIVFLFGHFGGFEDGFVYAIIIMNVFTPVFDTVCENALHLYRNKEKLKESIESDIKKAAQKIHNVSDSARCSALANSLITYTLHEK